MQIYIASSWRNQHAVEMLTTLLEERGHNVISFVRAAAEDEGRVNFGSFNLNEWIESKDGENKFKYDTGGATKSDLVIYIGPSDTDAWAEVGAAWASDVPIWGLWAKGEKAGLMRRMMLGWSKDYQEVLKLADTLAEAKNYGEERTG